MYMIWWIFLKIYLSIIDIWYISFDCFKWFKSIEFVHIHSSSIFVSSQTCVILLVLHPLSLAPTQWAFTLVCLREKWFSSYLFSVFVLIFVNVKTCILSNIVKHCHQISIDFTSKTFLLSYEVENTGESIQVGLPKRWYEKYNDVKLLIPFCVIYKGRPKQRFFYTVTNLWTHPPPRTLMWIYQLQKRFLKRRLST